ncbi:unnamed protein product [Polarella glacialis]|uniref:Uncharacterized protein n=1 Tax=Polarella glacialis TaxID=89957 RepID=A0A813LSP8_POLGL|nr:unnamed protein product [Polarella glacialis]
MARAAVFVVCSLLCLASAAYCGSEQDESCRAVDDQASLLATHRRIHAREATTTAANTTAPCEDTCKGDTSGTCCDPNKRCVTRDQGNRVTSSCKR